MSDDTPKHTADELRKEALANFRLVDDGGPPGHSETIKSMLRAGADAMRDRDLAIQAMVGQNKLAVETANILADKAEALTKAEARVEVLEGLLRKLANACDAVGVKYFDGDNECDKVDEMITATLEARAALGEKP